MTWLPGRGGYRKIKLIKLYSLGEPLLNPHIADWVRAIKEAGVCNAIEITTNASYLSHEMSGALIDAGLDILRVSVYGATEGLFSRTTGKPASIEQDVVNNVVYLVKLRNSRGIGYPKVYAKMMDTSEEENSCFFEKWENVADECGLDELFDLTSGENDIFQNMYGEGAEMAFEKSMASNLYQNRKICRYPFTHLTVRSDGIVVVCCADWLKETAYGNVMEHSLKDIWESKSLYEFRKEMVEQFGACHKCCQRCEIPLRDTPEDDLTGLTIGRFDYSAEI